MTPAADNKNQTQAIMTTTNHTVFEEIKGTAGEIIEQVKRLIREGNARQLIIKNKKGRIIFQSQLMLGVAGSALAVAGAPIISALTMFLLFVNDVKILVEKNVEAEPDVRDENEIDAEIIEISDDEEGEEADKKTEKTPESGEKKEDSKKQKKG